MLASASLPLSEALSPLISERKPDFSDSSSRGVMVGMLGELALAGYRSLGGSLSCVASALMLQLDQTWALKRPGHFDASPLAAAAAAAAVAAVHVGPKSHLLGEVHQVGGVSGFLESPDLLEVFAWVKG